MKTKSVKVGFARYRLDFIDQSNAIRKPYLGVCDGESQIIEICSDTPKRKIAQTIIHEILHAAFNEMSIYTLGKEIADREEDLVSIFSTSLASIMADNPKLFDEIREMLK